MKKIFLLALGLLVGECAFAQKGQKTLGLQLGGYHKENVFANSLVGIGGAYFDYTLTRRLGIRTSLLYSLQNGDGYLSRYSEGIHPGYSTPIIYRLHFVQVPVNIAINVNRRENSSWKTNLLFGYTLSYLVSHKYWTTEGGKKIVGKDKYNIPRTGQYFNLGFEVSHNLTEKYNLALNPGLSVGSYGKYPDGYLFFNLKFGRNI